jgi:hypothetical protein
VHHPASVKRAATISLGSVLSHDCRCWERPTPDPSPREGRTRPPLLGTTHPRPLPTPWWRRRCAERPQLVQRTSNSSSIRRTRGLSIPSSRNSLRRLDPPLARLAETPKSSVSNTATSSLARPFSGGAVTRTLRRSPCTPTTSRREAPGTTSTGIVTPSGLSPSGIGSILFLLSCYCSGRSWD